MVPKTLGVLAGVMAAITIGGSALAAQAITISPANNGQETIQGIGKPFTIPATNTIAPGSYNIGDGSNAASATGSGSQTTDPGGTGALTAQQEGTLTISYDQKLNGYEAVWKWSGLKANQQVMLIGDKGTSITTQTPETLLFGTASPQGGSATIFIPKEDYKATNKTPETFEMLALFGSTPTGQLPEVPYAAALPLTALLGPFLFRRLRRI